MKESSPVCVVCIRLPPDRYKDTYDPPDPVFVAEICPLLQSADSRHHSSNPSLGPCFPAANGAELLHSRTDDCFKRVQPKSYLRTLRFHRPAAGKKISTGALVSPTRIVQFIIYRLLSTPSACNCKGNLSKDATRIAASIWLLRRTTKVEAEFHRCKESGVSTPFPSFAQTQLSSAKHNELEAEHLRKLEFDYFRTTHQTDTVRPTSHLF